MQECTARKNTKTHTPTHPRTKGKTQGKRGKGNPPTQKKKKEKTPLGQKNPKRIDKIMGEHLDEDAQQSEASVQRELGQLEEKVVNKKKQEHKKTTPATPVVSRSSSTSRPKIKKSSGQRTPPRGDPKPLAREPPLQGPELKGPRCKQSAYFSRKTRTTTRDQPETQQKPYKTETICSGELGLFMRGGGAHGPPRCSEVTWWGPGHRRSHRLLPSREPPHTR